MKPTKKRLLRYLQGLRWVGVDPFTLRTTLRGLPGFLRDYAEFRRQQQATPSSFSFGEPFPCFGDDRRASGRARGHYFHQDLLVSRRIFENEPELHVDVGSRLDGFVAHVASFRRIEVLDLRPQLSEIPNITFRTVDIMAGNAVEADYCDSASSLHAVEHFGLGRYGDTIDVNGHLVGLANIHKMLKAGGKFYFSVPIGPSRVEFNAHRVFSVGWLVPFLSQHYVIDRFSYVDDLGELFENVELSAEGINSEFRCTLGCGIFELTKRPA